MTNKTTMGAVALIAALALVAIAGATVVDGDPSTFQVDVRDGPDNLPIMVFTAEGDGFTGTYTVAVTDLENGSIGAIVTNSMVNQPSFYIQNIVGLTLSESSSYQVTITSAGGTSMSALYLGTEPVITISMDGGSSTIEDGATGELSLTVVPKGLVDIADSGTVTWSSSKDGIVQISGGNATGCSVEALKPGSTTISASFTVSGTEYHGEYDLTVDSVPVTGVTVGSAGDATSVNPGETLTLTASVTPDNATDRTVTWTTSDPSVATVSQDGVVTGVAPGSVTITATAGGISGTKVLTVNSIPVQSISIGADRNIALGSSVSLECTFTPANATNKTVTWKSSDDSVATVSSDGTVVARGVGSATITVTTEDGNKMDEITVTVSAVPVTGIEIVGAPSSLKVGDAPYQLNAVIYPANASTTTVSWISSNPSVLSVSSQGIVTVLQASEAPVTVTATITDAYGAGSTFTDSVEITVLAADVPTHTIHVAVGTGGTVSPAGDINGNITVEDGDDIVFTVKADSNYAVSTVTVDGEAVTLFDGTYTFTDVISDHTISVTFEYVGSGEDPDDDPDYPVIPPYNPDDDYVPIPPTIVDNRSDDDDATKIVACAAAAVAAAILAAFIIMEYRKR